MSFLDTVKSGIKNHLDKKREEQERIRQIQLEVNTQRQLAFEEEYKKNLQQVLIAKAKRDAASKSGLQKLRAENRLRNLKSQGESKGTFFDKLREHTQKNLAGREERLKRTNEMRESARKIREEQLLNRQKERQQRMNKNQQRTPFSRW